LEVLQTEQEQEEVEDLLISLEALQSGQVQEKEVLTSLKALQSEQEQQEELQY